MVKKKPFFSESECKDLIAYYEANAHKIEPFNSTYTLKNTYILKDVQTPLTNKLVDFITSENNVKLNYLQIVRVKGFSHLVMDLSLKHPMKNL